jgi:hypothetical protein
MLVRTGPLLAAAALAAACSSSNKETRTADNQAGASQSSTATAQGTPANESPTAGSASGKVASVDPDAGSIILDQDTNPAIVIIIDENTRFVDPSGQAMSEGISGIHEGQQVRASLDPSSHRAEQIQVTKEGKADTSRRQQQDQELLQDKPKQ